MWGTTSAKETGVVAWCVARLVRGAHSMPNRMPVQWQSRLEFHRKVSAVFAASRARISRASRQREDALPVARTRSGSLSGGVVNARVVVFLVASAPVLCNADCIDDAAQYHGINPQLVRAIAQHESGMRPLAFNRNRDGSVDVGLMQINSRWLLTLARYGIQPENLWNPCINGYVGAWILKSNVQRFGPTWKAVGAYNAASPAKQLQYANQIYMQWNRIRLTTGR